jgi:hypothetical protein
MQCNRDAAQEQVESLTRERDVAVRVGAELMRQRDAASGWAREQSLEERELRAKVESLTRELAEARRSAAEVAELNQPNLAQIMELSVQLEQARQERGDLVAAIRDLRQLAQTDAAPQRERADEHCEWPNCNAVALCSSGNFEGRLVCADHFRITNGTDAAPQLSGEIAADWLRAFSQYDAASFNGDWESPARSMRTILLKMYGPPGEPSPSESGEK